MDAFLASTPEPPYTAVLFSSRLADDAGYAEAAERMVLLAREQPGFLGIESARDASGNGITVSYWRDHAAAALWRTHAEHRETQAVGRERFYAFWRVRIARVDAEYGS